MKSACGSIREWLGAFADNELDQARAEQVRVHLETCADCRRELDQILELNRLTKSVEHPQLADDYWDWHRVRVWRGIRERKHVPTPWYRPTFTWPRLAAAAAGVVVVLVVAISGWRAFLPKPASMRPAGEVASELKTAPERRVGAAPGAKPSAGSEEAGPVADAARAKAESRVEGFAQAPAGAAREAEKTGVGYAAKGGVTSGTASAEEPSAAPRRKGVTEMEVAADHDEGPAVPLVGEPQLLVSSKKRSRIVSGPVLLESPALPDADALDTGTVLLSVNTDSTGRVLSAAVRRSSGSSKLDSVAVRQMRQSRFQAAVKKNRHVASSFEYQFRLQKKQTRAQEQQGDEEAPKRSEQQELQKRKDEQKLPKEKGQPVQGHKSDKQEDEKQAKPSEQEKQPDDSGQQDDQEDGEQQKAVKEKTKK